MVKNDFKLFVMGKGVNVILQFDWEVLLVFLFGFIVGKVLSVQVNKVLCQVSFIVVILVQYIVSKSGQDVFDDGDLSGFIVKMFVVFGKDFQIFDVMLMVFVGFVIGVDKFLYFMGNDIVGQIDFIFVGCDIIGKVSIVDIFIYFGLGEIVK